MLGSTEAVPVQGRPHGGVQEEEALVLPAREVCRISHRPRAHHQPAPLSGRQLCQGELLPGVRSGQCVRIFKRNYPDGLIEKNG